MKGITNLAVFLASCVLIFGGAEAAVRILEPQQLIQVLGIWEAVPGIGWRHKPNLRTVVNTGEKSIFFATDPEGYRIQGDEFPQEPGSPPDLSVLMIGDSLLEALAVPYEKTIPGWIHKMFQDRHRVNSRIVNAGVGYWQPGQYLLEAKRALAKEKYDLGVVFFYIENDCLESIPTEFDTHEITKHQDFKIPHSLDWGLLKEGVLYPINNFLEKRSHLFVWFRSRFQVLLARMDLTPFYFPDLFFPEHRNSKRWEVTAEAASRIQEEFQKYGTPVFFVLLPADYQVDPRALYRYMKMFNLPVEYLNLSLPNEMLTQTFKKRSLKVVDTLGVLRRGAQEGKSFFGRIDNHMNEEGHRAVSEIIFPVIETYLSAQLSQSSLSGSGTGTPTQRLS